MCSVSYLKRMPWIFALIVAAVQTSAAQQLAPGQSADLQKQLEQLKQQYEQTTRELQQRISAMEQQLEKQKEASEKTKEGVVSAAELAAEQAAKKAALGQSDQVGATFQGQLPSEPTYDLLREADVKIGKLHREWIRDSYHGHRWRCNPSSDTGRHC
jgi:maltoporin